MTRCGRVWTCNKELSGESHSPPDQIRSRRRVFAILDGNDLIWFSFPPDLVVREKPPTPLESHSVALPMILIHGVHYMPPGVEVAPRLPALSVLDHLL